jgi:hypothetical protein
VQNPHALETSAQDLALYLEAEKGDSPDMAASPDLMVAASAGLSIQGNCVRDAFRGFS